MFFFRVSKIRPTHPISEVKRYSEHKVVSQNKTDEIRSKPELHIIWKNVQSLKSRARQGEFYAWLKESDATIMCVCETWLKGGEYLEVDDKEYAWVGRNRDFEDPGGGGVGFCIKRNNNWVFEESGDPSITDSILVKLKRRDRHKWEYLIGVVYLEVEGKPGSFEKNAKKMEYLQCEIDKAKKEGMKILVGGDLNGHIGELDGRENRNGGLIKWLTETCNLEILNCVVEGMGEYTWQQRNLQYHLDYVLACRESQKILQGGYITEIGEGVGLDHAGVGIKLFSRESNKSTQKRKKQKQRKLRMNTDWDEFGRRVDEEVVRTGSLTTSITKVAHEMLEEDNNQNGNRMTWVDEEVVTKIADRKKRNREHRKAKREYGEGSREAKEAWEKYLDAKEISGEAVARKCREFNLKQMKDISEGGNPSRDMWKHINGIMKKNKEVQVPKLVGENGEEMETEEDIKEEIGKFWGAIFRTKGEAVLGVPKERGLNGLEDTVEVGEEELNKVVKELKNGKATGEDEIAGEYLKQLNTISREQLRTEINMVFNGGPIPLSWKRSRICLIPKGGDQKNVRNYRPIAITSVIYKVAMIILRNRINDAVEANNFLGDVQGGFRKKRRTEDNLYILECVMELSRHRGGKLFLGFLDLEKAYDRVNREKLFEVLRWYGVGEGIVRILQNIYTGSEVKFTWKGIETEWIKTESGVRQGCPLSPLLFNLYVREIGSTIEKSGLGLRYPVFGEGDQVERWERVAGLMYADDIVLIAQQEEELQELLTKMGEIAAEYGLSFSERKSKVVRVFEESRQNSWCLGNRTIEEASEYKYLGVQVKGGQNGGINAAQERLSECRRVVGMIKFTANRSGERLVVGREAWKGIAVSKLMYGCGAIAGELKEINNMDRMQNEIGRWLWASGMNVSNALIRGETGWSTFKEREAKVKLDWALRVVFEEGPVSRIGRACAAELGNASRWWRRVYEIAGMVGMEDLMNIIALKRVNRNGLERLDLTADVQLWKAELKNSVEKWGLQKWREDMGNSEEMVEYRCWKRKPAKEGYVNASVGAKVRMLLRGGYLPLRGNRKFQWRGADVKCICGEPETEDHFLFQCNQYATERQEWEMTLTGPCQDKKRVLKGYEGDDVASTNSITYLGKIWNKRSKFEKGRRT